MRGICAPGLVTVFVLPWHGFCVFISIPGTLSVHAQDQMGPYCCTPRPKSGARPPTAEDSPQQSQMCAGQHNLEPLAEVERALLVVEVLHAPHPEGLGLLLVVGGEHFCRHKGEGTRVSQTIQSTRTADPRPRDAHAVPSLPLSCRQAAPAHGHQLATGPGGSGGLRTDRTTPTGCSPSP